MTRRRLGLLVGVGAAVGLLVAGLVTQVIAQGGRPTRFGEFTLEEVEEELAPRIADLIAAGETVIVVPPTPPDPTAQPFEHGPYRIIPGGFVGEVEPRVQFPIPEDFGIQASDPSVLRASPLWAEPAYLPDGFVLTVATTTEDSYSDAFILTIYERPTSGEMIRISRKRIFELPINAPHFFGPEGGLELRLVRLSNGRHGIHRISKQVSITGYSDLNFYDPATRIETSVEAADAPSLRPEDVVRIAESFE